MPLTIFRKSTIMDAWLGSRHAPALADEKMNVTYNNICNTVFWYQRLLSGTVYLFSLRQYLVQSQQWKRQKNV